MNIRRWILLFIWLTHSSQTGERVLQKEIGRQSEIRSKFHLLMVIPLDKKQVEALFYLLSLYIPDILGYIYTLQVSHSNRAVDHTHYHTQALDTSHQSSLQDTGSFHQMNRCIYLFWFVRKLPFPNFALLSNYLWELLLIVLNNSSIIIP